MPARHAGLTTRGVEVALALGVLGIGSLVYVLDRPAESAAFFSTILPGLNFPGLFGPVGNNLPTFAHIFSFAILTSVWLGATRLACLAACAIWLGIDSAFEIGQHPLIAEHLVRFLPAWLEELPILRDADVYFAAGTFDAWDLISIAAGATAAYFVTALPILRNSDHE